MRGDNWSAGRRCAGMDFTYFVERKHILVLKFRVWVLLRGGVSDGVERHG